MLCECHGFAYDGTKPMMTDHHPRCAQYNPERYAADLIRGLTQAMEFWGSQEDGIPEECWDVYSKAKYSIGERVSEERY